MREKGTFTLPESSCESQAEMKNLSEPVRVFADECLDQSPGSETLLDDVFAMYLAWCRMGNRKPVSVEYLSRSLRSAFQMTVRRQRVEGSRRQVVVGWKMADCPHLISERANSGW